MKTAVALICSLLLAGTTIVPAAAPSARTACAARPCCGDCNSCCASQPAQESAPISAAPVPSGTQAQLVAFAPAVLAWTLPDASALGLPDSPPSLTASGSIPLFERNCTLLL